MKAAESITTAETEIPRSSGFRPDIEGLRAIAILLVVGYHAGVPGLSGGYIGVDVFFALSGYLITGLLVREIEETGGVDVCRFYARRARRLLPALAVTLLLTAVVSVAVYAPMEQIEFGRTAIWTAAYGSNLYFAGSGTDYFHQDGDKNPLLHTWSLSVEEQFYLAWPFFLMLTLGMLSKRDRTGWKRRLVWWTLIAAGVSFACSLYLTFHRQSWAYFLSPTRAWEFAAGGLSVLLPQKQPFSSRARTLAMWSGWAGLSGIFLGAMLFNRLTLFPGAAALLPVLSTVLVVRAAASTSRGSVSRMLGVRPLQLIGQLSYSWYLWHWPVLIIGSALVVAPGGWLRAGLVLISLVISVASYRWIENPIRHSRILSNRHIYSLKLAALLAMVSVGLSLVWKEASESASNAPQQLRYTHAREDWPAILTTTHCLADYATVDVPDCVFAASRSAVTVVLFGDSHAAQWFAALEPIAAKKGWKLVTIMKAACAPVDAQYFYGSIGRLYTECATWNTNALARIRQLRPVLTIVASSEGYSLQSAEWRKGISTVVGSLAESSQKVLILQDTPRPDFDVPTCLARQQWRSALLPSEPCEFSLSGTSAVHEQMRLAARSYINVATADLSPNICNERVCRSEQNNVIMYRDSNHLTASFAKHLESALEEHIENLLAGKHGVHDVARNEN